MPHSFCGCEGLQCRTHAYHRKRTRTRNDGRVAATTAKRILMIATDDVASIRALSARIRACGFPVTLAVEALEIRDALDLNLNLAVVQVHSGRELRAYYAGRAAAEWGIPTLFVAAHFQTTAIESLAIVLPICTIVDYFCGDVELLAAINETLDNSVR